MNRVLITVIFFFAAQYGKAQSVAGNALTLRQCIDAALQNNVQIKQNGVLVQAAEVNLKQAKNNLLPSLNAAVSHGINAGRSIDPFTNAYINQRINYAGYSIGSNVVLFNGSSLRNRITEQGLAAEAAKMDLQQVKDNVTINVMLAYLQVLNNEELVAIARNAASVTQRQIERLEVLNRAGAINPPLLHDLRGQLMNDQLAAVNSENALATAKLTLTQLMNVPFDRSLRLEKIEADTVLMNAAAASDIYLKAAQQLGVVRAAELRKQSSEAALRAVRGELLPTVSLNGGFNTNYSSAAELQNLLNTTEVATNNYVTVNGNKVPVITQQNIYQSERIPYTSQLNNNVYSNIGVTVRLPIFNAFSTRNRIKLARLQVRSNELLIESTQLQLRQEVEQAHLNMTNAYERYALTQRQAAEYAESFRAAEVRFNAGVGTIVEYLTAKNNLDRANNNLVAAKYDYVLRKKILDYYSGNFNY